RGKRGDARAAQPLVEQAWVLEAQRFGRPRHHPAVAAVDILAQHVQRLFDEGLFHQKFLYGLKFPLSGGKERLPDGEAADMFFRKLSLEGEAVRAAPARRPRSRAAGGTTAD